MAYYNVDTSKKNLLLLIFAVYTNLACETSFRFAYKWNGRLSIYNSYSKYLVSRFQPKKRRES